VRLTCWPRSWHGRNHHNFNVPANEMRTIPQRQRSKGSLICTAALELSTNQVTHFCSKRKNTAEMIKMLEKLVVKYHDQDRIFLSWDAASWHASKAFVQRVDAINAERGNAHSIWASSGARSTAKRCAVPERHRVRLFGHGARCYPQQRLCVCR